MFNLMASVTPIVPNKSNIAYIFDVDGTLTPSRLRIDQSFEKFFTGVCSNYDVFIVTGSDKEKTVEQIGKEIYNLSVRTFNCSGNDVWEQDNNLHTNDWQLPNDCKMQLDIELVESDFPTRTGRHLDTRPGMVNFSIVGRGCTRDQRAEYIKWDKARNEREQMMDRFNAIFSGKYNIEANIGGETGIDIMPIGKDKRQILDCFANYDSIVFFGDSTYPGGNDYSLANAISVSERGITYQVEGWQKTRDILTQILFLHK